MGVGIRQRTAEGVEAWETDGGDGRGMGDRSRGKWGESCELGLSFARGCELARKTREALAAPGVLRLPGPVLTREDNLAPGIYKTTGQALVVVP